MKKFGLIILFIAIVSSVWAQNQTKQDLTGKGLISTGKPCIEGQLQKRNAQKDDDCFSVQNLGTIKNPLAPEAPIGFTVVPGIEGALQATLSWTNPGNSINGDPLTDLTSIKIYRNAELIYSITSPVIGNPETFVDNTIPQSDIYTYEIIGENTSGIGNGASSVQFIGIDYPGAPQDLLLSNVDDHGHLSWEVPVPNAHGGYFIPGEISYSIVRYPGAVDIASGITATEFTDITIDSTCYYYYTVEALNTSGFGSIDTSNSVMIGYTFTGTVPVGFGEDLGYNTPFNFFYRNSLSQSIYYAEEMGFTNNTIHGIIYRTNFYTDLGMKPVKIWMASTSQTDLSSGFIPYNEFTLVYEGDVYFPSGENQIFIPFPIPFIFTGPNLVIMTQRPYEAGYYTNDELFYYSTTPNHPGRTRYAASDNTVIDPENPTISSTLSDIHPDIRIYSFCDMVDLHGTVTDGTTPLADVKLIIDYGGSPVYSNENGEYTFFYAAAGYLKITASKPGYSTVSEYISLHCGDEGILDFELTALPDITVQGTVTGSGTPEIGLSGASINLYSNSGSFSGISTENGSFSIDGVLANNTYQLSIGREGYLPYLTSITVETGDVLLDTIILNEVLLPVEDVIASELDNHVEVSWIYGSGGSRNHNQMDLDHGTQKALTGFNVYRLIEGQEEDENLWEVLSFNQTDTFFVDSEWDSVVPDTYKYAIKACYSGNVLSQAVYSNALVKPVLLDVQITATTNDETVPYGAGVVLSNQDGNISHVYVGTIGSNGLLAFSGIVLGVYSLEVSFPGFDLWQLQDIEISSDTIIPVQLIETITIPSNLNAIQIDNLGNVMLSWNGIETREFVSFKVYLDNNEVGTTSDTTFILETLSNGSFQAGLKSVYTSGESELVTKDFVVQGVSVNDIDFQQLMIYPVPAKECIFIKSDNSILSIRLLDLKGQTIYQVMDIMETTCNIPLQEIKQGVYIIQINSDKGLISRIITIMK